MNKEKEFIEWIWERYCDGSLCFDDGIDIQEKLLKLKIIRKEVFDSTNPAHEYSSEDAEDGDPIFFLNN